MSFSIIASAAHAEDINALLVQGDQAFGAGEYQKALSIYQKVEPNLKDPTRLESMRERMRFAQKAQAIPSPAPSTQPASIGPRKPHDRPADGQALVVTLHELGNFNYDENNDSTIPEDVRKLDGCKIKISGQMLALDQAGMVNRFLLVNDLMSCCYGTTPKLQNVAYINLPKGKSIGQTTERLAIEGTLSVKVRRDEGFVMSIFEIEPTSIKFAKE